MLATAHAGWVRILHWSGSLSLLALAFSGFVILMAHPRLYWGDAGNDLTPALIELPMSRNYQHGGWETPEYFGNRGGSNGARDATAAANVVTAGRTYDIFNQNGWGRSLHFLAGWGLVLSGLLYLGLGIARAHLRRHILPTADERRLAAIVRDLREHLGFRFRTASGGPSYGTLQKIAYSLVIFLAAPLMVITGLAMSPAITAAVPALVAVFGGFQSARTIHFLAFVALVLFVVGHLLMVIATGFTVQMRGMVLGRPTPTTATIASGATGAQPKGVR